MIVTADWVLPVSGDPIEHGAVAVREGRIVEVGHAADVCSRWIDERVECLDGCILAPGLVNAHTHLALSIAANLVPPGEFHPWLSRVTKIVLGLSHAEFGHSTAGGALECLRSGTTVVGDIVYGSESLEAASSVGLGGVFFWEVLGITPEEMSDSLTRRGYPLQAADASATVRATGAPPHSAEAAVRRAEGRVRLGLSPHAPYSSGPALIQAATALARERGEAFAIHVSEAAGEVELIERGSGPFTVQAERLAHGFEVPGMSPVAYLDSLGVLADATCIHAVQVTDADIEMLARKARAVVLCPRSNAYLNNGTPPVAALRHAEVTLAIGTDSSASNQNLDLFDEARAVMAIDPEMTAAEALRAITVGGAAALGMTGVVGEITPGACADLVAVETSPQPGESPEEALLRGGGAATVRAVVCAGEWRVRDGHFDFDTSDAHAAFDAARQRARELLAQDSPR